MLFHAYPTIGKSSSSSKCFPLDTSGVQVADGPWGRSPWHRCRLPSRPWVSQLLSVQSGSVRHLLAATLQTHAPIVGLTVALSQDTKFLRVWVPVFSRDEFEGFVITLFRVLC